MQGTGGARGRPKDASLEHGMAMGAEFLCTMEMCCVELILQLVSSIFPFHVLYRRGVKFLPDSVISDCRLHFLRLMLLLRTASTIPRQPPHYKRTEREERADLDETNSMSVCALAPDFICRRCTKKLLWSRMEGISRPRQSEAFGLRGLRQERR
eukprot:766953-Hanusia_phi.AAC.3